MTDFDPRRRYRVYRVVPPHQSARAGAIGQTTVASPPQEIAGCEDYHGIGLMLVTLHEDGEFDGPESIGVMDTGPRQQGNPAVWLINPYARGRS